MTTLWIRAEEYLTMRHQLGFKLTTFGTKLHHLPRSNKRQHNHHRQCCGVGDGTRRSTDEVHWSRGLLVGGSSPAMSID
jgi:hypothetical protein